MTEAEWLVSDDPCSLLQIVRQSKPSERKVRLFNAAICRRFWDYLPEASQAILSESELIADGAVQKPSDDFELCKRANAVVAPFDRQYPRKQFPSAEVRIQRDAAVAVCYAVIPNELFGAHGYFTDFDPLERRPQSQIVRDVFGNPFRSLPIVGPFWLAWDDRTVPKIAQAIYDDRAFDRMPILADALEDSRCGNADILNHCRQPGEHVRGCWVVDLLLGKE
jgi:hypothetical protein